MFRKTWLVLLLFFIDVKSYRLPVSVIPSHYKIKLLTDLPTGFDVLGESWIQVKCNEATQNITLHAKGLNITNNKITVKEINNQHLEDIKIANVELNLNNEFLIISLEKSLLPSKSYEIYIPYQAVLIDGLKGFYRSSYVDEKTNMTKWLGITQFEATSAREAFPCFDEPAMKATFEIILGRNEKYSSISNMPLHSTEPIKDREGWYWDKFQQSVPMSTYLVAFMVSDFGFKLSEPSSKNNVTFRIWSRKDALNQVEYSRKFGPKALEYFEDFFDIKYPLPKQDMVAVPDFGAGAMENWGLITYREALLLFDPKLSSRINQHRIANVIAHELAHQWFGNLVTMKWWTDLWLNEGFATYMASRAVDYIYPEWKSFEEEVVDNLLTVFSFDALKSSHPVSVPIGHPNEIHEIFDAISYKKGSFLIRMMGMFLGGNTLQKGVSNYLKAHKYGNAEQDDLWSSLTEEGHKSGVLPQNLTVKTVMDTWTLQTGYPLVTVKRNYSSNTATLTQKQFFKDEIKNKGANNCWWIPVTYTSSKEYKFSSGKPKLWLSCDQELNTITDLPDTNNWVLLNIQAAGLYKVNYDTQNWILLSETLNEQKNYTLIPTLNRVQLLDDVFDLAWTGQLKYQIAFDLAQYLQFENEYLPWKAALSNLNKISSQLKTSSSYGYFKSLMKRLLNNIYEKHGGFEISESGKESLHAIKHQVMITSAACRFDVGNCISDAQELFRNFKDDSTKSHIIPNDLKPVVYCVSLKNGGEKEWTFLWNKYKESNVASEKNTILSTLGCTREVWLLRRFLEWSITEESGIRRQDSSLVFDAVASNEVGFYIAQDFLYNNIKDIHKHLIQNPKRLSRYLSSIASQTRSVENYEKLKNFINKNPTYLEQIKQGIDQSLETAKLNVQWQQRYAEEVKTLLRETVNRG